MNETIPPGSDKDPQARRKRRGHTGSIWSTRLNPGACYVKLNADDDLVDVCLPANEPGHVFCFPLNRREARLLARRIDQCLDATVIR